MTYRGLTISDAQLLLKEKWSVVTGKILGSDSSHVMSEPAWDLEVSFNHLIFLLSGR